ncbi:MAG: ComF family protein [Actinobacteria bacterium]|nr:ComF family protein [Actinomycetota bacterium]
MNDTLSVVKSEIIDLVYPVDCKGCGRFAAGPLCPDCIRKLVLKGGTDETVNVAVRAGTTHPVRVKAGGIYESLLKEIVLELKSSYHVYAVPLALLMKAAVGNDGSYLSADRVCYVPGTPDKIRKRGFNPAKVLAELIADHFGFPLDDCLLKVKRVPDQDSLNEKERRSNIEGVFRVADGFETGAKMILIDDVFTTGATAGECARTLIESGACVVNVLVGGRALLRVRRNSY